MDSYGTVKWSYSINGGIATTPTIGSDGLLRFGALDGNMYTLSLSGNLVSTFASGGSFVMLNN